MNGRTDRQTPRRWLRRAKHSAIALNMTVLLDIGISCYADTLSRFMKLTITPQARRPVHDLGCNSEHATKITAAVADALQPIRYVP